MPRNDDGEFELVLGNRQLISVFMIIVILLGVFFSMGYIVGRNSSPVETAEARAAAAGKPIVVEHPSAPEQPSSTSPASAPAETAPKSEEAKPAPSPPPASTHPAETVAAKPSSSKPEQGSASVARVVPSEPGAGDYWQVVATSRPDAEIVTEALARKGFKAMVAPAPKEGVFRVLVGPFTGAANMADTRSKLEAAGFKNPMMRKY